MTTEMTREVGRNIYDIVRAGNRDTSNSDYESELQRERNEANQLLHKWGADRPNANTDLIATDLVNAGVLPKLAIQFAPELDSAQDGTRAVDITKDELRKRSEDPSVDPLTRFLAKALLDRFDQIDGGMQPDGVLTIEELTAWTNRQPLNEDQANIVFAKQASDDGEPDSLPGQQHEPTDREREAAREAGNVDPKEQAIDVLEDPKASQEDKIRAVEKLAELGEKTVTLEMPDGRMMTFRIEVQPVVPGSERKFVHLYAQTESGHEIIALRAISENGRIEKERSNGKEVDYQGGIWSRSDYWNGPDSYPQALQSDKQPIRTGTGKGPQH